jgi:hypothetical protein
MVSGHWGIVCVIYSSASSVSSLCISPASFISSAQPVERKIRELEVENAMASGSIKASGVGPPTTSTSARRIASVSTRAAATIVFQFECPVRITHRTQASSSFEKSWRNTIRQDRRCQMLASSQNGHEILSIRGRFPPSTPELRVTLGLAPCKPRSTLAFRAMCKVGHVIECRTLTSSLRYCCMVCLSAE